MSNDNQPKGSVNEPAFRLKKMHYKLEKGRFVLTTIGIIDYLKYLDLDVDSSADDFVLKVMTFKVKNLKTKEQILIFNYYDEDNDFRFFNGIQAVYKKLKDEGFIKSPFAKSKE